MTILSYTHYVLKHSLTPYCCAYATLIPRAQLRGVAELHVGSVMPQWRMSVTYCYFYYYFQAFLNVTSPDEMLFTVLYFPSDALPMT